MTEMVNAKSEKGHPNSTRIMTEMYEVERNQRKCGICRETGHS